MARVAEHLSIAELEERFRTAKDPILARHVQVIWLLAQGHTSAEVSTVTSFVPRWIEPLRARYNAEGFAALGDLRRHNGRAPSLLKPDLLERLRVRLADPPPDGGLWTSGKVACWRAGELGLASVCVQRGWEALRAIEWSIQKPRPRHPKAATPEEESTFKKTRRSRCRRGRAPSRPPGRGVCDRRAPPRPEAGPAPRLGAQGRAPDRARPSPLQVALRHGLHPTPLGRDDLVSLHRRLQGVLCRAPCCLRRGKRGRPRAQHRARAGPSRLAHRTEPSRSRRDQAVPSAELHTRASARGASLARARRACREHLLCDTCRSRGRHRPALHRAREPRPAHRHKLPLVAQTRPTEVISRKPYETYGDYRDQLVPWESYRRQIATYAEQAGLPATPMAIVTGLREQLAMRAAPVDAASPANEHVEIVGDKPVLRRLRAKPEATGTADLERRLKERFAPIDLIDALADTQHWLNWT